MNVNGATPPPPMVYVPMQAIAPSVPNDHPLSIPTPDKNADPTPGEPFVGPTAAEKKGGHETDGALDGSAMLTPPTQRPSVVVAKVEEPSITDQVAQQVTQQLAAAVRPRGFDAYA